MGNFYLASELPRGENCHILAVDILPFWGESRWSRAGGGGGGRAAGVLPKVLRVAEDGQSDWVGGTVAYVDIRAETVAHWGHRRPRLVLSEQQVSPQTNALQNDRITREREREREKKQRCALGRREPTCCVTVIHLVHRNRCRKEGSRSREDTSYDWHDCGRFPIIPPPCPSIIHSLCRRAIRRLDTDSSTRLIYTFHL